MDWDKRQRDEGQIGDVGIYGDIGQGDKRECKDVLRIG